MEIKLIIINNIPHDKHGECAQLFSIHNVNGMSL